MKQYLKLLGKNDNIVYHFLPIYRVTYLYGMV